MFKTLSFFCLALTLLASLSGRAQTVSAQVLDQKTKEPIPYATVQWGEHQGMITNGEGRFSIALAKDRQGLDSLSVSCMGYETHTLLLTAQLDSIIPLIPKAINLDEVYVFDEELDVKDIMKLVEDKLEQNYAQISSKSTIFFRQSNNGTLDRLNIEFKKSTIAELDEALLDSIVRATPRNADHYTEVLGELYQQGNQLKLNIQKAAELYDKENLGSIEAMGERMENIFKANVKPTSFLKIKSGIFGTKVQVDSLIAESEEAQEMQESMPKIEDSKLTDSRTGSLKRINDNLFYQKDSELDVVHKRGRYDFEIKGYTSIDEVGVYIIAFTPGWRADFKGTLYVNMEDYAVMRIDYANTDPLKNIRIIGLRYTEHVYRGKSIFKKGSDGKYIPRYIEKEQGVIAGIDRPLKVIEKNKVVKGKNKQNELSLHLDITNTTIDKYEVLFFNAESISTEQFNSAPINKGIEAEYMAKYDPEFWSGYNIMEPNAAIKAFEVGNME